MIGRNESRKIEDALDHGPNAFTFGVYFDGNLVSTLRLHHASVDHQDSPSLRAFEDVVGPRLAGGETFVDPSRFAADGEWAASLRVLPYITLRLAMVAHRHFKPTVCLIAIREAHSGFYRRVFDAKQVVGPRTYSGLTIPVCLYQSLMDQAEARYPFFRSSSLERRLLFDRSGPANLALTVLPTVKYRRAAA
jgi:hypothetical protein